MVKNMKNSQWNSIEMCFWFVVGNIDFTYYFDFAFLFLVVLMVQTSCVEHA
jgi:hypothetical protein